MKKYLLKWKEAVRTTDMNGRLVSETFEDRVNIIEEYPCNLSDHYINDYLNKGHIVGSKNYYYDIIPLS